MLCVQIGLAYECEYAFFVDKDWRTRVHEYFDYLSMPHIPFEWYKTIDQGIWSYVGVDMNKESISFCAERYSYLSNFSLVHALIYRADFEQIEHDNWRVGELGQFDDSISLFTLFERVGYPNLLMMDVECAELPIIEGYDFEHKPEIVIIELHDFYDAMQVVDIMMENYYLISFDAGSVGAIYSDLHVYHSTRQGVFIRRDCIRDFELTTRKVWCRDAGLADWGRQFFGS